MQFHCADSPPVNSIPVPGVIWTLVNSAIAPYDHRTKADIPRLRLVKIVLDTWRVIDKGATLVNAKNFVEWTAQKNNRYF